ncbi:MAG TPA: carbohydrate porin [Moraxellaceae bacterium]|nr:carbohydrate porin [Moraxellaceae bacterium]
MTHVTGPMFRPTHPLLGLLPCLLLLHCMPASADAPAEPYILSAHLIADSWTNTMGGVQRESRLVDMMVLGAQVNTAPAFGHDGGTIFVDALLHQHTATDLAGETQALSNISFGDGQQLFEAWFQQAVGDNGSSVKAGLYDLNSEFDHIDASGLFLNSNFGIGVDFSQSGVNGPSIAPLSALALRGAWQTDAQWRLQAAVIDGVAGEAGSSNRHNHIDLGPREGALLVSEIVYAGFPGQRIGLGTWYYTKSQRRLDSPSPGTSQGGYAHAEQPLIPTGAYAWTGFVRAGLASPDVNPVQYGLEGGLVCSGPVWHADDQLGLAISAARNGDTWRDARALAGVATDSTETFVELTWQTHITHWLSLQPDLQYFIHPGTIAGRGNALLAGLRIRIDGSRP